MRQQRFCATTLTAFVCLFGVSFPAGAADKRPAEWKVLDHFVGNWKTNVTVKPSKSSPDREERSASESTEWMLNDRFIIGREISQPDGMKSLWLMTYKPISRTYPFWYFDAGENAGGQWSGKWDAASKTMTSIATDTPKGWTSQGTNHFPDSTKAAQ